MAIFRGVGGAGNATTDSEIALFTQLEQSSAESAANAAVSEANAALSATNAATSATNAATSATNAANSATASANSAASVLQSEINAATSATNAAADADLAKDWATKLVTTVDGVEFSSKFYAQQAASEVATIDNATLVRLDATQTLSNKTLTSPSINGGTITGITDLAVADGGTGASTANQAKINLSVISALTGSAIVPSGTQAQRDISPSAGYFRFNVDLSKFEGYNGTSWGSVGGGATGGGADEVFVENSQNVTTNYTITIGKNAMSAGPVTVNSGVTVTVPSGSRWVIV